MLETNTRVHKRILDQSISFRVVSATSIIFSKYLPEKQANVSTKVYGEERKYFGELCWSCFWARQPSWLFLSEIKKTTTLKILYTVDVYRVFSLTWPTSMKIYWNKRKCLHKKRVQLPEDWFGTPTWPPFYCFGTPIWPPWRHVKTLYEGFRFLSSVSLLIATLRERQKNNRSYNQNNNFARASRSFVHFFTRFCTTTTWKCLISRFMKYVNKQRRHAIFLFELGYGP